MLGTVQGAWKAEMQRTLSLFPTISLTGKEGNTPWMNSNGSAYPVLWEHRQRHNLILLTRERLRVEVR